MKPVSARLGFYAALVAFIAASGYSVVQLLQVSGVLRFPPWDEFLFMGFHFALLSRICCDAGALLSAPGNKKLWSHAALLLAIRYAGVRHLCLHGAAWRGPPKNDSAVRRPLSRCWYLRSIRFFWTLDAVAYICLGLSTLFAAFVFAKTGFQKWLRWFFWPMLYSHPL